MAGTYVIDIDQLVASSTIGGLRGDTGGHESSKPLLHRIGIHFRTKYKDAYEPIMLSIGPYNHKISATHAMQITKYELLDYILSLNHGKNLSDFLEAMKELEKQVRSCYAHDINMDRTDFLKMLLLDGCFMLVNLCRIEGSSLEFQECDELKREIHVRTHEYSESEADAKIETILSGMTEEGVLEDFHSIDQIFSHDLWHDLILLENQIPFLVIMKIHELVAGGCSTSSKPLQNIIELVETAFSSYPKAFSQSNWPRDFHHLLHLCHMYFIPRLGEVSSDVSEVKPPIFRSLLQLGSNLFTKYTTRPFLHGVHASQQAILWRQATEYHEAGIEFKKRKFCSDNPHSLLDIAFCDGMIEIPCLTIEPNTQALFCNLIAFEQTCPQVGSYITTYVKFLSQLLCIPDDAVLLIQRGIIVHQFNSDAEVCDLIKMIGDCVVFDDENGYLKPLCNRIEAYYARRRPVIQELLGSSTRKVHNWTRRSESPGLPTTISHRTT